MATTFVGFQIELGILSSKLMQDAAKEKAKLIIIINYIKRFFKPIRILKQQPLYMNYSIIFHIMHKIRTSTRAHICIKDDQARARIYVQKDDQARA